LCLAIDYSFGTPFGVFASAIPLSSDVFCDSASQCARGIEHNNQQSAVFTKTPSARRGEIADHCAISANFQLTPIRRAAFYCETAKSTRAVQTTKHRAFPLAAVGSIRHADANMRERFAAAAAAADDILKRISLMHLIYCQRTSDDFPHGLLTKQNIEAMMRNCASLNAQSSKSDLKNLLSRATLVH
jgi:hypothetical protein